MLATSFKPRPQPKVSDWEIPKDLPGRPISELKGKHSGSVAILMNGPSLPGDLSCLDMPTIGTNRTHKGWPGYNGPQPEYLCIVDKVWLDRTDWRRGIEAHPAVINGSYHEKSVGYRVKRDWTSVFSFDLEKGYACHTPGTAGHLALQTAVYLGFTDLYCYGFDLSGGHFDGTSGSRRFDQAVAAHKAQIPLLKKAGINVWVVGSPDSKAPFQKVAA